MFLLFVFHLNFTLSPQGSVWALSGLCLGSVWALSGRCLGAVVFCCLCQTATIIIWRQSLHLCGSLALGAACFNGSTPRGECVGIEACRPFATRVEPLGG